MVTKTEEPGSKSKGCAQAKRGVKHWKKSRTPFRKKIKKSRKILKKSRRKSKNHDKIQKNQKIKKISYTFFSSALPLDLESKTSTK